VSLAILTLALSWPAPFHSPEPRPDYEARVATIVQAAELESRSTAEALSILVLTYRESGWRRDVHDGTTLGDRGAASCLAQVHPHAKDWHQLPGIDLDSTRRCIAAGLRVLRYTSSVCGRGWVGVARMAHAFEGYASGKCRAPSHESTSRARAWEWAMVRVGGRL
jgi:hypothetical protein